MSQSKQKSTNRKNKRKKPDFPPDETPESISRKEYVELINSFQEVGWSNRECFKVFFKEANIQYAYIFIESENKVINLGNKKTALQYKKMKGAFKEVMGGESINSLCMLRKKSACNSSIGGFIERIGKVKYIKENLNDKTVISFEYSDKEGDLVADARIATRIFAYFVQTELLKRTKRIKNYNKIKKKIGGTFVNIKGYFDALDIEKDCHESEEQKAELKDVQVESSVSDVPRAQVDEINIDEFVSFSKGHSMFSNVYSDNKLFIRSIYELEDKFTSIANLFVIHYNKKFSSGDDFPLLEAQYDSLNEFNPSFYNVRVDTLQSNLLELKEFLEKSFVKNSFMQNVINELAELIELLPNKKKDRQYTSFDVQQLELVFGSNPFSNKYPENDFIVQEDTASCYGQFFSEQKAEELIGSGQAPVIDEEIQNFFDEVGELNGGKKEGVGQGFNFF